MSRSWSSAHDWKSCRGQKLLESSNLSNSAKKKEPAAGRFFLFACGEIRMCHRRPRWGLHRPVRTLGDSSILFSHPPQGKTKCKRISPTPPRRKNSTPSRFCGFRQSTAMRGDHGLLKPCQHGNDDRIAVLFFLCYDERRTRSRAFPGYRVTIGNQTGQEKKC